ncbi:DivIVA domain-containing protein [Bailinhaonella thermotolerans]|uniref:DivIVA domain-containing protein n=1 Tax=Bailinhaonella thermotolerans TaxID=1070861 RepID=UPI0011C371FE|nr:DivIVA domain-containing protein [Bailinhaonella thermotolerans]
MHRFPRVTLIRPGYDVDEVDRFIHRILATLGRAPLEGPAVTAQDVRDVRFKVRMGGYNEMAVDFALEAFIVALEARAADPAVPGARPPAARQAIEAAPAPGPRHPDAPPYPRPPRALTRGSAGPTDAPPYPPYPRVRPGDEAALAARDPWPMPPAESDDPTGAGAWRHRHPESWEGDEDTWRPRRAAGPEDTGATPASPASAVRPAPAAPAEDEAEMTDVIPAATEMPGRGADRRTGARTPDPAGAGSFWSSRAEEAEDREAAGSRPEPRKEPRPARAEAEPATGRKSTGTGWADAVREAAERQAARPRMGDLPPADAGDEPGERRARAVPEPRPAPPATAPDARDEDDAAEPAEKPGAGAGWPVPPADAGDEVRVGRGPRWPVPPEEDADETPRRGTPGWAAATPRTDELVARPAAAVETGARMRPDPLLRGANAGGAAREQVERRVARVEGVKFSLRRLGMGYDEREVDEFLDRVADTLRGTAERPLTAEDVRGVKFSTTVIRVGYAVPDVDAFMTEVAEMLEDHPEPR